MNFQRLFILAADAFEDTAEVGRIEDEFEILTMDSDDSKTEAQASKVKEITEEVDAVNALEKTLEGTAEQKAVEAHKESRDDKEDGDSLAAEAGNEDDKVIFNWI